METKPNDMAFAMSTVDGYYQDGLTKREYFAAMAMKGILDAGFEHDYCRSHSKDFAKSSVIMADAIIEELNKEQM